MANGSDQGEDPKELSLAEDSSSRSGNGEDAEPTTAIPEELLEGVPREHRQAISRAFSSVTQFAAPVFNPIFQKVTSEHVSQIIDNIEKDSVREHDADKARRWFQFAYFVLGAGATIGLIVFFIISDNGEFVPPIITGIAGFLGGLAAGPYLRN